MSKKFLYLFKEGHDAFGGDQTTMKNTLGGKGAGMAFLSARRRSHGSSFKKRRQASKVAPPQHSRE